MIGSAFVMVGRNEFPVLVMQVLDDDFVVDCKRLVTIRKIERSQRKACAGDRLPIHRGFAPEFDYRILGLSKHPGFDDR